MDLKVFVTIDDIIKRYSKAYIIRNRVPDLALTLEACLIEDDKEIVLDKLDCILPYGVNFSHTYENGKLIIVFKEV